MRKIHEMKRCFRTALLLASCAVLVIGLFAGLQQGKQSDELVSETMTRSSYASSIEYEGEAYKLRSNLTTVLVLGVDKRAYSDSNDFRTGGQSDFIRLIVMDPNNKQLFQIPINRDTVTPVPVVGVLGDRIGTRTMQICLAHGYGDGREESCKLAAEAVSNLLGGFPIDFYVSMSMDGISALNDLMGGITVTLQEDFTIYDATMTQGTTLTLQGMQAEWYVRGRKGVGNGTNVNRMARQEDYLTKLAVKLVDRVSADQNFIGTLFDEMEPYLYTNLKRGKIINM
ncbi:MAG: LCP family protein, partial [Clostridiales bacterium]|nr:LCP family protein [Clostridiales bacterium]